MPYKDHAEQLNAQRSHYRDNKHFYDERQKNRRAEVREWWDQYKRTLSCKCGENHPACLDFHHRNPDEKDMTIACALTQWTIKRILVEIAKCDVMCANCHRKLHAKLSNSWKDGV